MTEESKVGCPACDGDEGTYELRDNKTTVPIQKEVHILVRVKKERGALVCNFHVIISLRGLVIRVIILGSYLELLLRAEHCGL